jgi:hypothetical protein
LEIPDDWKVNETRDCQLRAINNGNVTLSSIVADIDKPDLYGIKLAFRWVKRNEVMNLILKIFQTDGQYLLPLPLKRS